MATARLFILAGVMLLAGCAKPPATTQPDIGSDAASSDTNSSVTAAPDPAVELKAKYLGSSIEGPFKDELKGLGWIDVTPPDAAPGKRWYGRNDTILFVGFYPTGTGEIYEIASVSAPGIESDDSAR